MIAQTLRFIACSLLLVFPLCAKEEIDPIFAEWQSRADPAIEAGLEYLARSQKPDGSFPENWGDCTGIPALVGMAFLSKGHMPTGDEYVSTITRCIDFVLSNQKDSGLLEKGNAGSGPMYAHNIATLFLSELSGQVDPARQEKIDKVLPGALKVILEAQAVPKNDNDKGGWRYHPGSTDSDTSCSGWALMALRSAKLNGAAVPDESIKAAVDYLKRHQNQEQGGFGYNDQNPNGKNLTGMGLLCLELSGLHNSPESIKAADYVMNSFRNLPGTSHELYGNYYNAQGMFQLGGKYWSEYANWMYASYLARQSSEGSWNSNEAGPVYGTAIMVLAFTVPYRQLPIYQRDETVDEDF
ncbi:MAG: terpene cyclase/mutase family protein [Armatimonadetes bacterium]|nr:terpene cyclase/mutase family protein [Akkermansiaceae bacterium]